MARDEFRSYIEYKYKGREVITTKNERLSVSSIADLNWDNLEPDDQRLALANDWAWGIRHIIGDDEVVKGILFRPTARDFLLAPEPFLALWGGYGSGKTLMGCLKIVMSMFAVPGLHAAIYRTTVSQVLNTTIKQLTDDLFPMLGLEKDTDWVHHSNPVQRYIELYIGKEVSRIYYRPFKDQNVSVDKIMDDNKSFNVDMLLVDESVRLGQTTHDTLKDRRGRWKKFAPKEFHKLILVGNPPDRHHYQYQMYVEGKNPKDGGQTMVNADWYKAYFMSTYDNRDAVTSEYIQGLEASPESWKKTYLYGLPGFVEHEGIAIYANSFNADRHVSYETIPFDRRKPLIRGWDMNVNGIHKACVIGQLDDFGTLNILDEVVKDDAGISRFVREVQRVCNTKYPTAISGKDFVDPAAFEISQIELKAPTHIMADYGFIAVSGDKHLGLRHEAVSNLLLTSPSANREGLRIDGTTCHSLVQGFLGGYKYKVRDEADQILSPKPDKNLYSHPHDALQYLCSRVVHVQSKKQRMEEEVMLKNRNLRGNNQKTLEPRGVGKDRFTRQKKRSSVSTANQFV